MTTTRVDASDRSRQARRRGGPRARWAFLLAASALVLGACGEFGGGESGETAAPQQLSGGPGGVASTAAFETTVYPLTTQFCAGSGCHATTRSPLHAHPDVATAHSQVLSKVDLGNPSASRMVTKLTGPPFHHCWSGLTAAGCQADAVTMTAGIQQWADDINFGSGGVSVNETLSSSSLRLADGVQDVGSERYSDNMIALWEFKEGSGPTAFDASTVLPAMDLSLEGADVSWLTSYGINIVEGRAIASVAGSRKLFDRIADPQTGTNQYSVELWINNARIDLDGPARIVTYSTNFNRRNFMLGQVAYQYFFRNRSIDPEINLNGAPSLETYDMDEDLQDRLQHVVMTFDQYRGRQIYVDAVWTDDVDEFGGDPVFNWDPSYQFVIGDEVLFDRQWMGQVRMVAIYEHALTDEQILQNYLAGVGQRLTLRFDVSQWAGPGSAVEFTVSDFDPASYLFCAPTYRMNGTQVIRLANLRIAVNGQVATTGQAFTTLDTLVSTDGQQLSQQCALIAKPVPPNPLGDEFALVFEFLAGFENVVVEQNPPIGGIVLSNDVMPANGLRDFARINETMAEVTDVDPLLTPVRDTYLQLVQQLPSGPDLRTFVSSHEVGISRLALEYCDALVEDPGLRDDMFVTNLEDPVNGLNFGVDPFNAFGPRAAPNTGVRDLFYDTLYDAMIVMGPGQVLSEQPNRVDVRAHLDTMLDGLLLECEINPCDAERTQTIVKGACAAVLSSTAVTVH